ncbi:sporulation peptidase YabG [Thermanaeromonas sp. C210]|uniref:sporulation peptidase YabG n=1 Tax=Thermanaeromonas sp. C210 TaxID=2731925 RepID=UPI00155CA681|nr:sporulation peptidase YabG [Thermanaeromonas sp. C210]GFN21734.1 peptidase [Thermanaeromonas sp. C210]
MPDIKPGDIVARKSYGKDIFFKVKAITITDKGKSTALLRGLDVRLSADAPLEDLEVQPAEQVLRYRHRDIEKFRCCFQRVLARRAARLDVGLARAGSGGGYGYSLAGEDGGETEGGRDFFELPGRVVHLDGDEEYLERCLHAYKQLRLPVAGFFVAEEEQAEKVPHFLAQYTPDILVLTGHDGLIREKKGFTNLDNYRHSKHFVAAVRAARKLRPSHDDLVIFAGACQSHYEALLEAGATFASSPGRILIHAFDPILVVEQVAYTSIREIVRPDEIIKDVVTGEGSIGGLEIRGKFRLGYPSSSYEELSNLTGKEG